MATAWLAAGVNPKVVSERLGHASVAFTLQIYGHSLPTQQAEAAGRMEEQLIHTRSTRAAEKGTDGRGTPRTAGPRKARRGAISGDSRKQREAPAD